jgi:hypothetical protein
MYTTTVENRKVVAKLKFHILVFKAEDNIKSTAGSHVIPTTGKNHNHRYFSNNVASLWLPMFLRVYGMLEFGGIGNDTFP